MELIFPRTQSGYGASSNGEALAKVFRKVITNYRQHKMSMDNEKPLDVVGVGSWANFDHLYG
jgi:hypothetical protein